jgi:hypothetical protein
METKKVMILKIEEAKEALIRFWASVLSDFDNIVDVLRQEGKLDLPNYQEILSSNENIAQHYGEMCIGEKILEDNPDVDLLLVEVGEFSYEFAAEQSQVYRKPTETWRHPVEDLPPIKEDF